MTEAAKLPYALDATRKIVSIKDVPNGLACNCTCPACGSRLVAKQGSKQVWHFSHHQDENCQAGYESALHLAVKAIFEADPRLALPPCLVVCHGYEGKAARGSKDSFWSGTFEYVTGNHEQVWARDLASVHDRGIAEFPGKMVRFDRVEVELAHGSIRPDLVGFVGKRRVQIEVAVTHFIDEEKLTRIRSLGVATLEIVVPPTLDPDWDSLRKFLLSPDGKYWRFNPRAEQLAESDYNVRQAARNEWHLKEAQLRKREAELHREERQKELLLKEQALERRRRKVALREEALQDATYGLAAEVVLNLNGDSFYVRWNKATVNISAQPWTNSGTLLVSKIARACSGRLSKGGLWEFLPDESTFFRIVRAVKEEGAIVEKFRLPEGMTPDASFRAIEYLLAPSHRPTIVPTPTRRLPVFPYCVIYRYGDQYVTISLDNTVLTLRVVPIRPNDELQNRINEVYERFRGQYNDRSRQLEFPPVEANFFAIASSVRPTTPNDICRLVHPENIRTDDVLRRLGFEAR